MQRRTLFAAAGVGAAMVCHALPPTRRPMPSIKVGVTGGPHAQIME
jgi:ABC-type metal ion transport system substrate-binding protein